MFNKNFYPTPKSLIDKMISKINGTPATILEPSAGKGDIVEAIQASYRLRHDRIVAIEKDSDLRATLRGKNIKVIDSDFLTYSGPDKFDLIIANPPFDEGDKHLLKAIDIMYRGQIIFLLNVETLRNAHANTRKALVRKLKELNATFEVIKGAFKNAERPTGVEVVIVDITIERKIEDDLFKGADDKAKNLNATIEENHEVSTKKHIPELVAEYNQIVKIGIDTIVDYYRNYKKVGKYIGLNQEASKYSFGYENMTAIMQEKLNQLVIAVREDFWRRCLDLKEVRSRMTEAKQAEFEDGISKHCDMDFTENNIRSFVLTLIGGYEQTLTEAVLEIFDMFTIRHSWDDNNKHEKNIHYFNGWKTNKAFKVGKKVIIPIYAGYGDGPFIGFGGGWKLDYGAARKLRDIDVVMNYFDGMNHYHSIAQAVENNFAHGISSNIESTYFTITVYKKGTIHLTFNDENILRRFNVAACRGKDWLPCDYGIKPFDELPMDERATADSFEGKASYQKNLNQPVFANTSTRLQITVGE
uniref:DUF4942 domain-containing protein n=1 Tax=viral metagenome TaxID=1070528 RepID=A0A6M3M883_9ZZZZ